MQRQPIFKNIGRRLINKSGMDNDEKQATVLICI
jgi:hypothetical protein